ncbi:hypothetical protein AUH73_00420 [archaeon 13_1_40CM_4_53_4]|nr:MAG: hypothetical protein AUH73_00420 [archaeon 13_1_40CM_4_53_4]
MVRKIIQWVPIDGTRWRNEFVNGHENQGVSGHSNEKRHEEGGLKDDQLQRLSPTEISNRRRQVLPPNCAGEK